MDDDDAQVPVSAAHILTSFFAAAPIVSHPAIRARVPRVHQHLRTYVDTEAEHQLTPDELALVAAERQLEPADAVLRVTGAEALVAVLPGFCHVAWLLPVTADARAQLRVVTALRHWVGDAGYLDGLDANCLLYAVDDAVRQAQAVLDRSPATGPG